MENKQTVEEKILDLDWGEIHNSREECRYVVKQITALFTQELAVAKAEGIEQGIYIVKDIRSSIKSIAGIFQIGYDKSILMKKLAQEESYLTNKINWFEKQLKETKE